LKETAWKDEKCVLGEKIKSHSNCLNTPTTQMKLPQWYAPIIQSLLDKAKGHFHITGGRTWEKSVPNTVNLLAT